jgi:hypothetical protein
LPGSRWARAGICVGGLTSAALIASGPRIEAHPEPDYPDLEALLGDLRPRSQALTRSQHPFPVPHVRRYTQMVFNLASYSQLLMDEFMRDGGEIPRLIPQPEVSYGLTYRGHNAWKVCRHWAN